MVLLVLRSVVCARVVVSVQLASLAVGRARVGRSVVHSFVRSFPKDALSQTVADARHGVADAADVARERLGGER